MAKLRMHLGALVLSSGCYAGVADQADGGGSTGATSTASEAGEAGETAETGEAIACGEGLVDRAPLRRLTRFEYNNTVRDLLGDATAPANAFPSEEIGNGFGNDADAQPVSSLLVEQYSAVGEEVAARATETPEALAKLAPCLAEATEATEVACVRGFIESFAPRAYRRPLAAGEADELLALYQGFRLESDLRTSVAAVLEALLQSPDFLYRVEQGTTDAQGRRRPTGHEMATRLSYFLWGTTPDAELIAAAESGELLTDEGVFTHATRMLEAPQARAMIRHFFDNLLPISSLAHLERDEALYPTFSGAIGALMREETHRFLEHAIFEGEGTWPGALTAEYTFVNGPLAAYYGIVGVEGEEFRQVPLDLEQRLGLLTQAGVVAGTIHSNTTNPVVRGSFLVQKIMCMQIPLPDGDILEQIKPPDPGSGATARERFSAHSQDPVCKGCHQLMDPVGLALENYDAVGLWRDAENGVTIDASGAVPGTEGTIDGPVELVRKIAEAESTHACFATHWLNFAYGRTLAYKDETCAQDQVRAAFTESGHDIRTLLLELTQTDAFLYLPAETE